MAKNTKRISSAWVISLAVLCLVAIHVVKAEVTCLDAMTKVFSCQPFLLGGAGTEPNAQCCLGAQELDKIAGDSQPDRRAICECFKTAAQSVPLNLDNAKELPRLCNLTTTIPIDPNVDCNAI